MDYIEFLNEVKVSSDSRVKMIAQAYGIDLSISEIRALRPLLDEISFHWIFTGIPESFIAKVRNIIGDEKTKIFFRMYQDAIQ